MISVEANRKGNSTNGSTELERERPSSNSQSGDAWNADAFAKRINDDETWKETETIKNDTRVQDISVGLTSSHGKPSKGNEESWPYEKSPCRLFGGKNTKKGGEDVNKELFDADFVDQSDGVEFSDGDSFYGEDDDDEKDVSQLQSNRNDVGKDSSDSSSRDRRNASSTLDNDGTRGGPSHTKMLAWNKRQDSEQSLAVDDGGEGEEPTIVFPRRASSRSRSKLTRGDSSESGSGRGSISRSTSQRGGSLVKSRSQRGLGLVKSSSQRALGLVKSGSQRALGLVKSKSKEVKKSPGSIDGSRHSTDGSRHKSSSSQEQKSSSINDDGSRHSTDGSRNKSSSSQEQKSSSYNDDGSRHSKEGSRHKSSSSQEQKSSSYNDDGSRHSKEGSRHSKEGSRHSKEGSRHKSSSSQEQKSSNNNDDVGSSRRKPRRSASNDLSAATVHGTERVSSRRMSRGAPARGKSNDGMSEMRGSSRRGDELGAATLHGNTSVSRIRKERRSSIGDSSTTSARKGKPDRRSMMKRAMSTTNVKRPEEYHGGTGTAQSPRRGKRPQKTEPRRDLMDLLREQKTVIEKDLLDRENRRVLHCLMLEHKMGISLKELARTVRSETKDGVVPVAPNPPLYVEA
jgi:hypothetical protein